jgi:hypothetical protein
VFVLLPKMAQANTTSMEDAISILVDTITNVLLVFEEAAADSAKVLQVGATDQLANAVGVLNGIARQIAGYIDPEWKGQMTEVADNIGKEQALIASFSGSKLTSDQAETIHASIKRLLGFAVKLMSLNDLHQVRQTTNTGKIVAELLARLSRVENPEQLMEVGKEAVPLLANLKELFFRRLKVIANPERTRMLQRCMDVLTSHSVLCIETARDHLLNPNPQTERAKIDVFTLLIKAIIDGMEVIEASSQFLQSFDIEFFFPGGGGYRKPIDPSLAARIGQLAGDIGDALRGLADATARGDAAAVVRHAQAVVDGMREAMELARALAAQMDDPVKKAALLEAASTLEWIGPELLKVTKALLDDPNNPELLRRHQELMDKANAATTMIKLAATVGSLEPLFAELFQAIAKGDEPAAMVACDKIIANIDDQIAAGRQIAETTKNPMLKQKILDAIAILEEEKEKLKPAVIKTIRNPQDQDAKDALQAIVNNIAAASSDLADAAIVPMSAQELATLGDLPMGANAMEREAVERAQAIHDALDKLIDAVKRGDARLASEAMKEFIEHARQQIQLARDIAKDVQDPALRKELLDAANNLEALIPQLQAATDYALAHPDDMEAQQRLKNLARQAKDESAKISHAVVKASHERVENMRMPAGANAAEREAAEAAHGIFQALDDLWDAVLRGDAKLASEHLSKFKEKAENQIRRAREIAATCKDPALKRDLENAANKLEALIPQVEQATAKALANPNDAAARQHLADLMAQSKAASSEIASLAVQAAQARLADEAADAMRMPAGANAAEREAVEAAHAISQALDDLWDAVLRGDAKLASEHLAKFKEKAENQIRRAREIAATCKDPALKRALENAANKLEALIPQVEQATAKALANPNDAAAQQHLADLMAQSKAASSEIASLAKKAALARLADESKPKTMHIDQRVPQHVANALRGVEAMASKSKFGEDTHQGQLVKASRVVADILQEFALAAENLDKKGMIAASRKLVEAIKDVNMHANAISKSCTNPMLAESLTNIAQAPQNYGVQLKLVAAVKSNTQNDIRTAKGQMYAAAKNIADALAETIRAGEMAAMKSTDTKESGFAYNRLRSVQLG